LSFVRYADYGTIYEVIVLNTPRLPSGKQHKHLFPSSARTWIVTIAGGCVIAFLVLPLAINRFSGANAVALEAHLAIREATPTPIPFSAEALLPASRDSAAAHAEPEATAGVLVSQFTLLQENDNYPTVSQLQDRLMELGYLDSDEPTTVFNAATTVAVKLFQRTIDEPTDGIATGKLQEQLFSADATPYEIKLGDSGTDVESMQSRLNELGYYEAKINGYFGVATEEALRAFQTKNKLNADGVFSVDDRDLLYSPEARPKIDPTPTPSPKPTPKPTKKPTTTSKPASTSSGSGSTTTSAPAATAAPVTENISYSASYSADGLISVASAMLGIPYAWSEESPSKGFDCSGLVYFCLRTCGVSTSRYSASGFSSVSRWTEVTSISDLQRGDLVFFKNDTSTRVSHTGIFIGGGKFIHASSSSGKVITSSITTAYWTRNFVNGRRVF
jgi:cell wall-associated NlpC family hydrolase